MTQLWLERLGSTLLHFVWQGVVIASVYSAACKWAARSRPEARYILACMALLLMAAAPLLTWMVLRPSVSPGVAASFAAPLSSTTLATVRSVPPVASVEGSRLSPAPFLSWVVGIWFTGAVWFALRLTGGWISARGLQSRSVRPAPAQWQQALNTLRTRIQVSRPVRLLVSSLVHAPTVVGWLRPVVLIPVGALAGLPGDQVEALLLHELAHIRRHDYFISVVQSVVEALLFYHPAVWWLSGHIRAERELCCDDIAVSVTGDVLTYARALSEFAAATPRHSPAVAANGGSLAYRVARLLGESRPAPHEVPGSAVVAAAALLGITAFAVFGQPAARPQFDAASVKPDMGGRGFQMVRPLPGRLTASASLRMLVQNAYSVQTFQIVGGPAWTDSDRFEIEAKAAGNASREQILLMLQSLLEERFQLRVHRESRELPVFALVAAKGGLKLSKPKDGACTEPPPDAPPDWAGGRMQPPGQGQLVAPRCGTLRVRLDSSGVLMEGGKVPMAELTRTLSMVMDRTVVDKSGFPDLFDVHLTFQADQSTAALPPPPSPNEASSFAPSISTALQEQLGLRVESAKGPVDVLVIDRVEKPSVN